MDTCSKQTHIRNPCEPFATKLLWFRLQIFFGLKFEKHPNLKFLLMVPLYRKLLDETPWVIVALRKQLEDFLFGTVLPHLSDLFTHFVLAFCIGF